MPGIIDWKMSPLQVIDQIFNEQRQSSESWVKKVHEVFKARLSAQEWTNIPSMNGHPNHAFVDGQLVRFRGMIQDMFDPELYLSEYEYEDPKTGVSRISTCRYRESTDCSEDLISFNSAKTKHDQRFPYFCTIIPGESEWVKDGFRKSSPQVNFPSGSKSRQEKRERDESEDDEMDVEEGEASETQDNHKRPRQVEASASSQIDVMESFIDVRKVQSAIIKVYEDQDDSAPNKTLLLNDAVEFIGILSMDPQMAQYTFSENSAGGGPSEIENFDKKELIARNPPPSLVPRLHVLHYEKLVSGNPLLPFNTLGMTAPLDVSSVRDELHQYLTKLLFGDALAANYLICHLISRIYIRNECVSLGKFSVNLFNVVRDQNYPEKLAEKLQTLMVKSVYLKYDCGTLNKVTLVPKKDYESNRLSTGILQLSPHSHLILDETGLAEGRLETKGVHNVNALASLIQWQRIAYQFDFQDIDYNNDIPCLVLSDTKSTLPSDAFVRLCPGHSDIEQAISASLSEDSLNRIRLYLSIARFSDDFELTDDMQKIIQEDFVRERSEGSFSTDDLHSLLVLARLLSLSRGIKSLNSDLWNDIKQMEKERKVRIQERGGGQAPSLPANE